MSVCLCHREAPTSGGRVDLWSKIAFLILVWDDIILKLDKSRNLFNFVLLLLSASVERVGVSRMRDFFVDKSRNLSKIVSVLLSASVERFNVSRMRDFYFRFSLAQ